ncbi:MAG: DUF3300 domain-containing protein [Thermodesulfovibrionales bacterium]
MRASTIIMRGLAWMIIAMLVVPPGIPAQDYGQPEQTYRFSEAELAQMLAPIALYPDSLIAQILMASTYPLEVVEAERWVSQNKNLQGDPLDDALRAKPWDPSIKTLCHFPDVLFALSDKLDQTRKLGDAFLSQQDDVMNTIQVLRRKAQEQGNLTTTSQQKVIVQDDIIRVEPNDPYEVYVPAYDPYYVYGTWGYPSYPPWYWYYPAGLISGAFIAFSTPFLIGFDLFLWPWFDWHGHYFYSNYYYDGGHHHHDRYYDGHHWEHDPSHRKGVAYRDRTTSQRFDSALSPRPRTGTDRGGTTGRQPGISPTPRTGTGRDSTTGRQSTVAPTPRTGTSRDSTTGRQSTVAPTPRTGTSRDSTTGRQSTVAPTPRAGSASRGYPDSRIQRQDTGTRQSSGVQRQSTVAPSGRVERQMGRTAPQRDNTFRGVENGSFERRASERGSISRQSKSAPQSSSTVRQSGGAARQSSGSRVGGSSSSGGSRTGSGGSRGGGRGAAR